MDPTSSNLFNHLPVDVLSRVMWHVVGRRTSDVMGSVSQATTFRDAYSLCIACPRLEQYFRSSWFSLCLDRSWCEDDALDAVRILGPTVRCLTLEYTPRLRKPLHELAQVCGNLTSVRLGFGYDCGTTEDSVVHDLTLMAANASSSMRALTFDWNGLSELEGLYLLMRSMIPSVGNLTKISIGACQLCNDEMGLLLEAGSNLRSLTLSFLDICGIYHNNLDTIFYAYELSEHNLERVRAGCPNIQMIRILASVEFLSKNCQALLQFVTSYGSKLREVTFRSAINCVDCIDVHALATICTNLKRLVLPYASAARTIAPLQPLANTLESLSLRICKRVKPFEFRILKGFFPKLRYLRLDGDRACADAFVEICEHVGAQLHVLNYCGTASESVLSAIGRCSQLRALFVGIEYSINYSDFELDELGDGGIVDNKMMGVMLSRIGHHLHLLSVGGGETAFSSLDQEGEAHIFENVTFSGYDMVDGVLKYCRNLEVLQILKLEARFHSEKSFQEQIDRLQRAMPELLVYRDEELPAHLNERWCND